jgi:hypothetical protein
MTPLNIINGNATLRFTGSGMFAFFAAGGLGDLASEQFVAYHVASPGSSARITPGTTLKLRSLVAQGFCRLVPLTTPPSGSPMSPSPTSLVPEK